MANYGSRKQLKSCWLTYGDLEHATYDVANCLFARILVNWRASPQKMCQFGIIRLPVRDKTRRFTIQGGPARPSDRAGEAREALGRPATLRDRRRSPGSTCGDPRARLPHVPLCGLPDRYGLLPGKVTFGRNTTALDLVSQRGDLDRVRQPWSPFGCKRPHTVLFVGGEPMHQR